MKKTILTVLLAVLVQLGFAQVHQGNWTATGSIGYNKTQQKGDKYSTSYTIESQTYSISPTIGYVIANNVEVGLLGSYNRYKANSERIVAAGTSNSYYDDTKSWSAGVYTRAYKFLFSNFAVTGQADVNFDSYLWNNVQKSYGYYTNESVSEYENSYISATIRPGISYFMSDKISLNATYGFLSYTKTGNKARYQDHSYTGVSKSDHTADGHSLVLNLSSSSFGLGLSFYF